MMSEQEIQILYEQECTATCHSIDNKQKLTRHASNVVLLGAILNKPVSKIKADLSDNVWKQALLDEIG